MTEDNNIMTVGFIGGGPISAAICKGILKNDLFSNKNICVSPMYDNFHYWEEIGAKRYIYSDRHAEVFENSHLIFFESEPENIRPCLNTILQSFLRLKSVPKPPNNNVLFISMVEGIHTERLREQLFNAREYYTHPPHFGIGRILTNNLFGVANGVCLYSIGQTNNRIRLLENTLEKILSTGGTSCVKVTEDILHLMSPLIYCGPAFVSADLEDGGMSRIVLLTGDKNCLGTNISDGIERRPFFSIRTIQIYLVIEAITDGAVKQGVPRKQAQRIAAHIVAGSGQMVLQSGTHPALLKDEVCNPGAMDGISVLEDGSLRSLFIKAVEACSLKFNELVEKFQKWV